MMKVIIIANVSANGKVLLAENSNHQPPKEAIVFFVQKTVETGSLIIGRKTFEVIQQFPGGVKGAFPGVEVVILSNTDYKADGYKVFNSAVQSVRYLNEKGFNEITIGGGTQTYNAFLEQDLVTDIYLNFVPVISGSGGVIGTSDNLFTLFKLTGHKLISENIVQLILSK